MHNGVVITKTVSIVDISDFTNVLGGRGGGGGGGVQHVLYLIAKGVQSLQFCWRRKERVEGSAKIITTTVVGVAHLNIPIAASKRIMMIAAQTTPNTLVMCRLSRARASSSNRRAFLPNSKAVARGWELR